MFGIIYMNDFYYLTSHTFAKIGTEASILGMKSIEADVSVFTS